MNNFPSETNQKKMSNKYFFKSGLANLHLVSFWACVITNAAFSESLRTLGKLQSTGKNINCVWRQWLKKIGG